jgi:hypothetical protein
VELQKEKQRLRLRQYLKARVSKNLPELMNTVPRFRKFNESTYTHIETYSQNKEHQRQTVLEMTNKN